MARAPSCTLSPPQPCTSLVSLLIFGLNCGFQEGKKGMADDYDSVPGCIMTRAAPPILRPLFFLICGLCWLLRKVERLTDG